MRLVTVISTLAIVLAACGGGSSNRSAEKPTNASSATTQTPSSTASGDASRGLGLVRGCTTHRRDVTLGIYSFWVIPRLTKWVVESTDFA